MRKMDTPAQSRSPTPRGEPTSAPASERSTPQPKNSVGYPGKIALIVEGLTVDAGPVTAAEAYVVIMTLSLGKYRGIPERCRASWSSTP
ncbi:hypothetical protein [Streptomyces sp. NPDC051001]|uniref:hypothetical protein n=1 Tax=Streptomyces sp. NPDC051001 TaxID=3155795 RepID=UPI0034312C67